MTQTALAEEGLSSETRSDGNLFLTFQLAGDVYAIDILDIKEIIEYGSLTPVPMMPAFIAGVINLRGRVVPVVDLAVRFEEKATEVTKRTSIVIVEVDDGENKTDLGVVVDAVNEVLELKAEDIGPPPAFGARIRTDFIRGMGKVDGRFLVLLDVDHVLSLDELSMVSEMRAAAADGEAEPQARA